MSDVSGNSAGLISEFEQLERVLGGSAVPPDAPAVALVGGSAGVLPGVGRAALGGGVEGGVGRLAVAAFPLSSSPGSPGAISFRAREQFYSASTIKVFILLALLERVAAGDAYLSDELVLEAEDLVGGSGVLNDLTPGRPFTLRDIATLMIIVSDNTATNVLVDFLGVDNINASIQAHGWAGTVSGGKLMQPPRPDGSRRSPSMTCAADLADHFARLWRGELLPAPLTEVAKGIYRRQQYSQLGRFVPFDKYSAQDGEAGWRIASKTGSVRGVRHDAGVFEPVREGDGEPFVVAVLTDGCVDERYHANNLGERVIGWAAAEVFERLA